MPLSVGERLGPYEIVALIGAGGMGEVYRARDTRLHRTVAIKLVRPERAGAQRLPQAVPTRGARHLRAESSPHLHLTRHRRAGRSDYLVMEYVEGESLAEALKRGPQPVEYAVRYGVEIAEALAAAHARGIIHRDLKPGQHHDYRSRREGSGFRAR